MQIKQLFDASKDIYRSIEKVITYGVSQQTRLKAEIGEYVVTDSIEEQFHKLLTKMDSAMQAGGENEVGVWVSGFYGSGKSSFTKYLGLAFDESMIIDGVPFQQHLKDRLKTSQTKALLTAVAKRYPAAVLMLDLASEQVAGATMEEVSTVLYYKVLQWAGYSHNLKVAALERRLKKEGRYQEFLDLFAEETGGLAWSEYRNDVLVVESLIPAIAHKLYPQLFKTDTAFNTEATEVIRFENDRVQEMLEIAREASGKEHIIFIIDEVGQYVSSRPNLILNLDGLAKNLKAQGNGKVWIIGTAQQTLTEDDPRASLNSPQLFKLKDRFPIQIDLAANDIKEICYTRLLGKSAESAKLLSDLFDTHGQSLRHHTKLEDARAYGADFDRHTFVNLYPFLPAHFDILLHLLGALAKSTGGIGLRSAIKVIQDILVEGGDGKSPVADQPVGWLATTVTLYDALEKDIQRAFANIHKSVTQVTRIRFSHSLPHQNVAKTVAVLQILGNLPVTRRNVISLMHDSVAGASREAELNAVIEELITDPIVPFGEQDGYLCFFSDKLNTIEQERSQITLKSVELKRIINSALGNIYSPLPSASLPGNLAVTTGLKAQSSGGMQTSLAGERNPVQTVVEWIDPQDYDAARSRLEDESRHKTSQYVIYLLGRTSTGVDELTAEIFRCREIANKYRNDPDQEIKDYCNGQSDRALRLNAELERLLARSLMQGSFIFRGHALALDNLGQTVLEAAREHLSKVAGQIFSRYNEAPVRAGMDLAEKFLRASSLSAITSAIDPLSLVQLKSNKPYLRMDLPAVISIRDYLRNGASVDGRRISDFFGEAPFGWSPDTLRYLVAAMLMAGEIKLRLGAKDITINGQMAIDALKNNNAFKNVGVALRDDRPSMEMLAKASERLTDLIGDTVVPLEDEISKAALKLFQKTQYAYATLPEKLKNLGLPGPERVNALATAMGDILATDASTAPQTLGGEESWLYDTLKWAGQIKLGLDKGLEQTLGEIKALRLLVENLPQIGDPGTLKNDVAELFAQVADWQQQPEFYRYAADFNTTLTTLKDRIKKAAESMQQAQVQRLKEAEVDLRLVPEWSELTGQEQYDLLGRLEQLQITVTPDADGLKALVNRDYEIQSQVQQFKARIRQLGQERLKAKLRAEQGAMETPEAKKPIQRQVKAKLHMTSLSDLDSLIQQLQQLQSELKLAHAFELRLDIQD